jgi:glycerophosphoryl diester phosphodiesterase
MLTRGCTGRDKIPLIIAHRGASYNAPENTVPAFLLAWEQGADAIEGDFFLTADDEIVCIHDPDTYRITGKSVLTGKATLDELRLLDAGRWKGEQWRGAGIPTLGMVLETVPEGKKIFIEIKSGIEILPTLYQEIDRSGLHRDQVVIISFSSDVISKVKSDMRGFKAIWLSEQECDGSVLETLEKTGADGFSSDYSMVTGEFVRMVLDAGYEYHVFTVNEPEAALKLMQYGVCSITTDRPDVIRKILIGN